MAKTTMEDVAQAAETSRATVYHHLATATAHHGVGGPALAHESRRRAALHWQLARIPRLSRRRHLP
ncbi:TetR family transcriptional regulator [Gordonia sp. (in: high G+C Gram-positive bacteria)]|uniref:TetR family transcriptional regulator n=1 Tax=Gordonia sp. (in: high G+C Gram-positive bacteria) TaxID=84139 RepID=UPI003C7733DE